MRMPVEVHNNGGQESGNEENNDRIQISIPNNLDILQTTWLGAFQSRSLYLHIFLFNANSACALHAVTITNKCNR